MGEASQYAEHESEAVEQGRSAAENVGRREIHPLANESRIIDQITESVLLATSHHEQVRVYHTDVSAWMPLGFLSNRW